VTGRFELLQKINQNTFSVYIAPKRDIQNALIPGPVQSIYGPITYLSFGHTDPALSLPPHLKHLVDFRRVEGMGGLIGAMKKDESDVLFIQYSREHLEEYEHNIPLLAEECKNHARFIAPVVIIADRHDHIIEALGRLSDRYIILTGKNRSLIGGKKFAVQKTLNDYSRSKQSSHSSGHLKLYGQQSLPF